MILKCLMYLLMVIVCFVLWKISCGLMFNLVKLLNFLENVLCGIVFNNFVICELYFFKQYVFLMYIIIVIYILLQVFMYEFYIEEWGLF